MNLRVSGDWKGWNGETIVQLSNGTYWRQAEYLYEHRYAYRPAAEIIDGRMMVEGMKRAVRVQRISVSTSTVDGAWNGWGGSTELRLVDGSKWRQAEYHYEYNYAFRPSVIIFDDKMLVSGMSKPIRVIRN